MKNNHTSFVPVHAIEYAAKRRHFPSHGGWKIPVDFVGKNSRHYGFIEIKTAAAICSDSFINEVKETCRRERDKGYLMEVRPDQSLAALYTRQP